MLTYQKQGAETTSRRRPPTEAQRERAAERRSAMRELAKRVSAMTADDRRALADRIGLRTIEGHALSVFNACMVYMQKNPPATVVGGFRQWLTAGRCVRKGEHGFAIWVPIGRENGNRESSEPTGDDKRDSLRFMLGTVFDVSQTDAVEVGAQT